VMAAFSNRDIGASRNHRKKESEAVTENTEGHEEHREIRGG